MENVIKFPIKDAPRDGGNDWVDSIEHLEAIIEMVTLIEKAARARLAICQVHEKAGELGWPLN